MQKIVKIEGMMCQHCVKHITEAYSAVEGVSDVVVDLEAGTATFESEESVSEDVLAAVVNDAGFVLVSIS